MDLPHLLPGTLFAGRYRVERTLKAGGMGAVHVAHHDATKRRVALKVMRRELVANEALRRRFVLEAQVASLFRSRHVVDVTDAGIDDATGMPFLVMELLEGEDLGERLRTRGRLDCAEVLSHLRQTAKGLDRAHAAGVIHRDLKPDNLFRTLDEDGASHIKILDFGIAKIVQGAEQDSTLAGGTPLYMAPEQMRKSSITPAADVWPLGLIAYTLLVGRPYWHADSIGELYGEVLAGVYGSPTVRARAARATLPGDFDAWFFRCVARDPRRRFGSAGEAIAALVPVMRRAGSEGARVLETVSMAPPVAGDAGPTSIDEVEVRDTSTTSPGVLSTPSSSRKAQAAHRSPDHAREPAHEVDSRPPYSAPPPRRTSRARVAAAALALSISVACVIAAAHHRGASVEASAATAERSADVAALEPAHPQSSLTLEQRLAQLDPYVPFEGIEVQAHPVTRREYALYLDTLSEVERATAQPVRDWPSVDAGGPSDALTWVTQPQANRFCTSAVHGRLLDSDEWSAMLTRDQARAPGSLIEGDVQEWTSSTQDGFGIVRGAHAGMSADEAATARTEPLLKAIDATADAPPEAIAGRYVGFRCAR